MLRIIAIGKKHEDWIDIGLQRYQKRCKQPWSVKWELLQHSSLQGNQARQEESERILSKLSDDDYVILLDERGQKFDSPTLSSKLERLFVQGKSPVFVVGGAFGVNEDLQARADLIWSLSPLVFPHQLVRLILIEQIYRAQEIAGGGKYHHG